MKKFLKGLTIVFFVVLIIICGFTFYLIYNNNKDVITEEDVREFQNSDQIINNPYSGFSQLSDEEKATYLRITNEIENLNPDFYLTGNNITEEQLNKITNMILKDHPEYFYVNNFSYRKNYNNLVDSIMITYTGDSETVNQQKQEVENWKNSILAMITPEMSNYEVAKLLHDHLVNNTEYNVSSLNNQNLLSVVEGQQSVCAGYSKAYQYLLNEAGIFATYVSGEANVGPHAWNLVEIDGEYGFVDVTWDDPSFIGNNTPDNFISHQYFGISTDQLSQTRTIDTTYETIPTFNEPNFNYYVREGLSFDLSEPGAYYQIINLLNNIKANGSGSLEVRLANYDQVDQLLNQLSYDPILYSGTITYVTDGISPIINFVIN